MREIVEQVHLCDASGRLNPAARGWSRRPLHVCNLRGRFLRKKKWEYWCFVGEWCAFSATVANVDYGGGGGVYLLVYDTKQFVEHDAARLFLGTPKMPETTVGRAAFAHKGLSIDIDAHAEVVRIRVSSASFGGKPMEAEFEVQRPAGHETLNVVVPWDERTFQFTSKQNCLPASGFVTWGGQSFVFDAGKTFAVLDHGRGIWPYRTRWNWGAFSARSGDDIVGVNMGARWTDGTGMNENGICLNGTLHKVLDDVVFTYDDKDFMKPWMIKTATSGMIDLVLTPFYERASNVNLLLLRSKGNQVFGRYSGTIRVGDKSVRIDQVVGWAEQHIARW